MAGRRQHVAFLAGRGARIGLGVLGAFVAVAIVVGIFGGSSSKPRNLVDASTRAADSAATPTAAATPGFTPSPSGARSDAGSDAGAPSGTTSGTPSSDDGWPGLPYSAALAPSPGTGTGTADGRTTGSGTAAGTTASTISTSTIAATSATATGTTVTGSGDTDPAGGGPAGSETTGAGPTGAGTARGNALAPAAAGGPTQASGSTYYANCTAARAAGIAPLYRGDPGYRAGLDADDDGIACETTSSTTSSTTSGPAAGSGATYYANCTAARDAGVAPLYRGDPGYRSGLDADDDGIACETTSSTSTAQRPPATTPAAQAAAPAAAQSAAPSTTQNATPPATRPVPATESTSPPPPAPTSAAPAPTTAPVHTTVPVPTGGQPVGYANCAAARAAGVTPLHSGDAGYSSDLDRDGDGIACE
ncbi:excalibur calcium-binding domain-containing protein [Frankia sp. AvcI1]|uniref:excalibur calcium-binding domain-containing protein n=1 Tax=Frankia sp. AvcI1 TaxID=573496 RepID=UPI0021178D5B|nr:excalibur calcium-binding domain-containing protein [Frankia sp. AvcI1]